MQVRFRSLVKSTSAEAALSVIVAMTHIAAISVIAQTSPVQNPNMADNPLLSEIALKLSAHRDAIHLNGKLFARIQELYEHRDNLGLDPESAYLIERYYKDFVRAGAKLADTDKEKLKKINTELATLQTQFEQNVLKEKNASSVVVDRKEDLAG